MRIVLMILSFLKLPDSPAQIERPHLEQLLLGQVEIKDIEILDKVNLLGSFWNRHGANVDL
ncbi:hypothetical protein M5D96_005814 [Drosophila gunungcola]|uniref:Uncharacterized protein n=1 Tax=Drosophila gunungcola TaxID=103775 RepID=A0A9P9YRW9_9MUSC|nr:hypothetical protein M5D96_005814 [Drosophila gunungcola]